MKKPNVIWVFGDQHRGQSLGINGDVNAITPNIDNLSRLGVNFTGAVSGFPLCCPFRGSLLTSKYPHKCVPGHEYQMDPKLKTIAHVFNDNNYHTAYFGKWHVDGYKEQNRRTAKCDDELDNGRAVMHIVPPERRGGFQRWFGYDNNNSPWDTWVHGGEGSETKSIKLDGYETDCLTDMLIDYLSEKKSDDSPFFAVLSVQPPHDPYVAPAKYARNYIPENIKLRENVPKIDKVQKIAKVELAGYYAQIENLDWNLGRIRQALNELHLEGNTHIIFFSDHGDMHGSHGQFKKTTPYQEAISIPFIIGGEVPRYNGRLNGSCDVPLNHVDIAPTTLGLCNIEIPEWMEGTNYAHYRLRGREIMEEPDSAYLQSVIATGHEDSIEFPWRGIVTKDGWKYVCFENNCWLMFNLNEDPYEQVNLAHNSKYKHKRKKLNDRLQQWIDNTDDKFTLPSL
jgi:arylsulfatase A-like enzyme